MTFDFPPPPRREGVTADTDLLSLAYPYALDSVSVREESAIAACLAITDPGTRRAFHNLTRDAGETMALLSAAYSTAPPPQLRARILDAIDCVPQDPTAGRGEGRTRRFRWLFLAAAAAGVTALAVSGLVVSQLPGHLEPKPTIGHIRLY